MKKSIHIVFAVLALASMLVTACGAVSAPANLSAGKVKPSVLAFIGVIEAMNGDQWTIAGQTLIVDPLVVSDGPYAVGDTVKVEGMIAEDGSISVTSVETPSSDDLAEAEEEVETEDLSEDSDPGESPDDDNASVFVAPEGLVFDDDGKEAFGQVDSISAESITVGGQTFPFANGAEFKDGILAGDFVKVHFMVNPDGSLSITEIELTDPTDLPDAEDDLDDEDEDENEVEDEDMDEDEAEGDDDNSGSDSGLEDEEDDHSAPDGGSNDGEEDHSGSDGGSGGGESDDD